MNEEEKYPFEVLYEDGSQAWTSQEDKKPWGIIFEGYGISLQTLETEMDYYHAQHQCHQIKIGEHNSSCGEKSFWEKIAELSRSELGKINKFIKNLKGDPLEKSYWISTPVEKERTVAWYVDFDDHNNINIDKKYKKHEVRVIIKIH